MKKTVLYTKAFDCYYRMVYRRIAFMASDRAVTEMLAERVYEDLIGAIGNMNTMGQVCKWLIRTAHLYTLDYLQSHIKTENAMKGELLLQILAYISDLDEASQFIYLSKMRGWSYEAIAAELGCQISRVELQYMRIQKMVWSKFQSQWRKLYDA